MTKSITCVICPSGCNIVVEGGGIRCVGGYVRGTGQGGQPGPGLVPDGVILRG